LLIKVFPPYAIVTKSGFAWWWKMGEDIKIKSIKSQLKVRWDNGKVPT